MQTQLPMTLSPVPTYVSQVSHKFPVNAPHRKVQSLVLVMNSRGAPTRVLQRGEEGGGAGGEARGEGRSGPQQSAACDVSPPVCADSDACGGDDDDDDDDDQSVGQLRSHR